MDNKESKIEECMEDQKQQDESTETPVQETENPENNEEETLAQKLEEAKDRFLRKVAEFDNFKKRTAKEKTENFSLGICEAVEKLLPVLDNLERALAAAENADADALKTGVEMTRKQMVAAYEKLGVTPIDRLGEKFDPNLEEAIMQGTADDGEPGTVCMVLQKGYMMDKTVLRHAMVKVVPD